MEVVLTIAAPVFGIAILGYLAQSRGWLQEGASQALASFVFNFAVPALLFRATAREPLPADLPLNYLFAYYLPTFAIYVLAAWGGRLFFRRSPMEGVIAGMATAYPNVIAGAKRVRWLWRPGAERRQVAVFQPHRGGPDTRRRLWTDGLGPQPRSGPLP